MDRITGRLTSTAVAVALALSCAACRDAVPPFSPAEYDFADQLTFGTGQDIAPQWTRDGEQLIYSTNHYDPLPCTLGVLLTIPSRGGTALPTLDLAQRTLRRPLAFPALSLDGERIAYFDRFVELQDCEQRTLVSGSANLRVRRIGSNTSPYDDPSLLVNFNGPITPPAWSRDNERLLYSDGAQLFAWRVGEGSAQPVPGGEGGRWPAWDPQGDRFVFSVNGALFIMRIDGTQRVSLGAGDEPAWSPDGQFVYARLNNMIVRIPAQGGPAEFIGDTNSARTPAVSPDGRRLAFARSKPTPEVDYDIWVIDLPH